MRARIAEDFVVPIVDKHLVLPLAYVSSVSQPLANAESAILPFAHSASDGIDRLETGSPVVTLPASASSPRVGLARGQARRVIDTYARG
jgi:hypothetical protein